MPKKSSFKQMRALASRLPVQFQDSDMFVKGSEIIKARGEVPKGIDSDAWYRVPIQRAVNHYRRIKRLFGSGGYAAVNSYIDGVIKLHAEQIAAHANTLKAIPTQPMSV